jgi:hypothetical protein
MPTAKGKVTAAAIVSGTRVMIRLGSTPATETYGYPSETKVKDAVPATVETIGTDMDHSRGGKARRSYLFDYRTDDGKVYKGQASPAQTFWLAPSSTTEAKEATMPATTTKRQPASKPAPANGRKTAKATAAKPAPKSTVKKETTAKATVRSRVPVPSGFKSWEDPKLATRVLKEKASGKTIKEITAGLGLPTDERHAHKVSLVYRKAADAKGTRTTKRSK